MAGEIRDVSWDFWRGGNCECLLEVLSDVKMRGCKQAEKWRKLGFTDLDRVRTQQFFCESFKYDKMLLANLPMLRRMQNGW